MNFRKTLLAVSIAAIPCLSALAADAMMAGPNLATPQETTALIAKLAASRDKTGLDADHGFAVSRQHPGVMGTRIARIDHTYRGVRIFHSESVVVSNAAGDIISESSADLRRGLGKGSTNGIANQAFSTTPALSNVAATDLVVKSISANAAHAVLPSAELIIYPVMKSQRVAAAAGKAESMLNAADVEQVVDHYELAYLVKTRQKQGIAPLFYDTVVNANTGKKLAQWKAVQTVIGTGHSEYSGDVPINTTLSGSVYNMIDTTRGTGGTYNGMFVSNANHGNAPGTVYSNPTNVWGDGLPYNGGSTTSANGQTVAVDAMWGMMNTYDLLKNTMGWMSLNGNNKATYIAVHVGTGYDNAYYDDTCACMSIGDGTSFTPLASLDVIGHEMSHGVIAASSNLTYSGEPGGLNESGADIGGEMVEAYAKHGGTGTVVPAGNDWMMGKEIAKNGLPLRWMYKPSKDGSSRDAWSSTLGTLDVHYASGPNNRMFYFLSQGSNASSSSDFYSSYLNKQPLNMTGIGNDHAYHIWFRALTTKFTSSTNYLDARNKMVAAAQELYGTNSKEYIAVQRAYAAINVGADVPEVVVDLPLQIVTQPTSVSVPIGTVATLSVTAGGGIGPYTYQWLLNGAPIAGATSATYSVVAQGGDVVNMYSCRVTDAESPARTITSNSASVVGTGGVYEHMVNGSFESGTTGWTGTTANIGTFSGEPAYDGTKNAWMGGNGTASTETLSQTINIPATATSATLTFALHIDTAETSTTTAYDKMTVTVKNTAGTVLGTLATYSNLNKASGYQMRSLNLLPYKGQTVTLVFTSKEDSSLQTSFVIDKVSAMIN